MNFTIVLVVKFDAQRLLFESKANPIGLVIEPPLADRVTAGTGLPVAASRAGVNMTNVLPIRFAAQRLPLESKASGTGWLSEPPLLERVILAVGVPDEANCATVNSTIVVATALASQALPAESNAMLSVLGIEGPPMLTTGVGLPDVAS